MNCKLLTNNTMLYIFKCVINLKSISHAIRAAVDNVVYFFNVNKDFFQSIFELYVIKLFLYYILKMFKNIFYQTI